MGVAGKAVATKVCHEGDELGVPVHGLDGTEAQAGKVGLLEDLAHEPWERGLRLAACWREVAAPAAEVDAGEDKFVAACGHEAAHPAQD